MGSTGRERAPFSCCCSPPWPTQDVRTAAGTTKAINLATNVAALAVFLVNGAVLIPLGLAAAAFNIAGNWLGSTFFDKKGALILRPIMLVVIVLFAIRLVTDLLA